MSAETPKKEPTASEAMFFYAIVKHTKNKADIDWSAVAVEQGFKNAEVAKVRFGQVKRKLGINGDTPARATPKKAGSSSSTTTTPTKVTKTAAGRSGTKGGRGKKVKTEDDDDSPSKVPKKEEEDEEEKEEDGPNAQIQSEMGPDEDADKDPF